MDAVELLDKVDRLSKRGSTEEKMRYNDYHAWRNTPAFRHGDISHTLFPRNKTSEDCVRCR